MAYKFESFEQGRLSSHSLACSLNGECLLDVLLDCECSSIVTTSLTTIHAIPSHMCGQLRYESVIDVILHLIRAQGRVVKQKPAHDHAAMFDGVENEADRFNQFWSDIVTELNIIANSFHVFTPEKLMYIRGRPNSVESKRSPVRSLTIFS